MKEEGMVTARIEPPLEKHFRLLLEDLGGLLENPDDEKLAKSIRDKLTIANKAYHKNLLFDWLKRKLFEFGVYHNEEFSLKLFMLKKRKVEKLVETFRNITAEGIIRKFISQVFVALEEDLFGNQIEEIVELITSTVYDGNTQAGMMKTMQEKVPLEIEDILSENIQDSEFQERKLEKHVILFDRTNKIIYWTKESFETLVQQVKDYQRKIREQESECTSLNKLVALIGKIRERQTRHIISLNSVNQQDLSLLSPELREKIEKMMQENDSTRTLVSQGFNTSPFHFILEFIQNADDNEYNNLEDGVLEFHFNSQHHSLKIKSNECGFTYDNLYALAGMADSDKVAKKLETPVIGEKGIGFKTVFSVCNEIHLLSNGFDVRLTSHKLFEKNNLKEFELTYGTEYEMKNINKFDHSIFDKYTLLTLKNIKKVVFKDDENTTIYSLLQKDKNNLFELVTEVNGKTKSIECFYAFSSSVDMSGVVCEKRPNFKTANLTLFYPEKWEQNKRFKLHSYLPVKEDYNLQLLIQSDFLLIQNRESLVEDQSNWNNSIIDEIPKLIVQSLTTNSLRNKSIKDVSEWKYDIFNVLQDCPRLHFKDVKPKTIELLKSVKCIPVMDESKFELPSKTILIGQSPVHPFKEFGIVECTKILGMHCIDPKLEEHLVKDMFSMQILNKSDVLKLVNELPCDIKLNKRVQLYQLMEYFEIDVCAVDVEIIPTKLTKLLKPKEIVCCFKEYNFSEGALKILEKFEIHKVADDIAPYFDKLLKPLKKTVRIEGLSNDEKFVLWVEETGNSFVSETLCLTTDGQWLHPSNCYFQSVHTQYLNNAKFVDLTKLEIIVKQHSSRVTAYQLEEVLFKHGVKKVPILFKGYINPTEEFDMLTEKKNTTELIHYLDNNLTLFENEKTWIEHYLNSQVSNLYEPKLRNKFGDAVNYVPYTKRLKLKAKPEDFNAHKLYIQQYQNASSIKQGLEYRQLDTVVLLRNEPLLKTTDGDFVELDDNNSKLFVTLDRLVKKYRPNWRELHSSYKYEVITKHVQKSVGVSDLLSILKDDNINITLEDQQYFIVQILNTDLYYTTRIMVTIDGKKKLLSEMYWDLDKREVFSVSVNELLLHPHFTSASIKKHVQGTHDIHKCKELCTLLQTLLKKVVTQQEKLENIERVQLETLISSKFTFSIPNEMVWELEELSGIDYFQKYNLTRLFGASAKLVKEHDTKKETRRITNTILSEFIQQEIITDNQFLQAWKYAKKVDHLEVFNLIIQNGLIVHNNKKHHYTSLFRRISKDVQIKFPHLQSLLVSDQYIDFNISQEIPIDLLCKEIEKLENQKEGNDKCFTLYKEIDRQLKEGTINDVTPFKKFKIFRNDRGQHCSKIYYCENQEVYNRLGSLVDCLFLCDNNAISYFLQAFEILPISQRVSYSNLIFQISDMTFELLQTLIGNINLYLHYNKFNPKEITIQIVKMINMKATIDGIQKDLSPDIHSDIKNRIIYIREDICNADKLFKEKRFSNAFLQFYPQLEKTLQDCVKLLILAHGGTEETIEASMSLILPFGHEN